MNSTEFSERTREWVGVAFKEIDQFAHHYAYENSTNPLQAKIDTVGSLIHGGCSLGKDLVTLQVQLSLGPFLKPHEMQAVLQHIDDASTTVGTHYIQGIKTINPRFNPNSAAYKVGHFTGKYILPTIGPGVVRARPPTPSHLTTKAAQMLETLEARLAAQSEAFFPELHPAITSGPRSLPTQRVPSTTKPPASLSRTGASKPPISTEPPNLPSGKKVEASKLAQQHPRKSHPAFNFTGAAAKQLSRQERAIPVHILEDVIKNPMAITKDPRGALEGSRMYYSRMHRNGKLYNVEVLYDKTTNEIIPLVNENFE